MKSCFTINGKYSDFCNCDKGVLQGEMRFPILFALYVNDCENEV